MQPGCQSFPFQSFPTNRGAEKPLNCSGTTPDTSPDLHGIPRHQPSSRNYCWGWTWGVELVWRAQNVLSWEGPTRIIRASSQVSDPQSQDGFLQILNSNSFQAPGFISTKGIYVLKKREKTQSNEKVQTPHSPSQFLPGFLRHLEVFHAVITRNSDPRHTQSWQV